MSDDADDAAEDFRAATELIERYGDGAALVAANHVSTARERGEVASHHRWSRILVMIEKLQRAPMGADGGGSDPEASA
jgi:hypothetical protein